MRILFYIFLGLICAVLSVATFVMIAAPTDFVSDQMIIAVKKQTGRDLVVAGGTSITIYPKIGVRLKDVTLSPPPGMSGGSFATMDALEINVPLMPLFRREIAVDRFVLLRPVFDFRIDKNGRKTWSFGSSNGGRQTKANGQAGLSPELQEFAQNSSSAQNTGQASGDASGQSVASQINDLRLGDIRIVDGTVRYQDARSATSQTIEKIDINVQLDDLNSPLEMQGRAGWRGQLVPFNLHVTSPGALIEGRSSKLRLAVGPSLIAGKFSGALGMENGFALDGQLQTEVKSLRQLAAWLGVSLPDNKGYGAMLINGRLRANAASVSLNGAKFTLGRTAANGDLFAQTGGARPFVRADVNIKRLVIDDFVGDSAGSGSSKSGISDLINQDGNSRPNTPKGSGWDRQPMEFAALKAFDMQARLGIRELHHKKIKIGKSRLSVGLKNGLMKLTMQEMALYEGQGSGTLIVDARRSVPTLEARVTVDNVSALPLFKDAADFDWIAGRTKLGINVKARGKSQRQIMKTLAGRSNMQFLDGAIVGVNIPQMLRGVQSGQFNDFSRQPSMKTDFTSLTASFDINKGVAVNRDLNMIGPLVRVTGAGKINIGDRNLDYRVEPKLVSSLEGQGNDSQLSGLTIPVRIHGPWSKPKYAPDLAGILSNPQGAVDAVQDLVKKFKNDGSLSKKIKKLGDGKSVENVLQGLFGGSKNSTTGEQTGSGGDLLNNLLSQ